MENTNKKCLHVNFTQVYHDHKKMINLPEINKLTQRKRIIMKFHMYKYIYNFICTNTVFLCYPFKS